MGVKEKLFTASFVIVMAVNFATALAYYLIAVKIVEFAYVEYGVSYSVAGSMVTSFVIAAVITRLAFGGKMDKFGLRRSVLLGEGLIAVASALYVVKMGFWPLMAVRVLHGIGFAISTGALAGVAALLVPQSRRGEGISYFSMSTALAMGVGPLFAMLLMNNGATFAFLFVLTLVMGLLAFGASFLIKVPSIARMKAPAPASTVSASAKRRFSVGNYVHLGILPTTFTVVPLMFCYSIVVSFMTVFAEERNLVDAASIYFLVYSVTMLITRPPIGKRLDKRGENSILYATLVIAALGLVLLGLSHTAPMLLASAVLLGVGVGATQSTVQAIVPKYVDPTTLGKANSTYFLCLDTGYGLGPVVVGAILPLVGYTAVFIMLAVVTLGACAYYHLMHGRKVGCRVAQVENEEVCQA